MAPTERLAKQRALIEWAMLWTAEPEDAPLHVVEAAIRAWHANPRLSFRDAMIDVVRAIILALDPRARPIANGRAPTTGSNLRAEAGDLDQPDGGRRT